MSELFNRTMFLEMCNYPTSPKDCMRQAVKELMPDYELIDLYMLYGITYDEYLEDMTNAYLRYKANVYRRNLTNN